MEFLDQVDVLAPARTLRNVKVISAGVSGLGLLVTKIVQEDIKWLRGMHLIYEINNIPSYESLLYHIIIFFCRECLRPSKVCEGEDEIMKMCNTHACPSWSDWDTPLPCSKTCGGGVIIKKRKCLAYGKSNAMNYI